MFNIKNAKEVDYLPEEQVGFSSFKPEQGGGDFRGFLQQRNRQVEQRIAERPSSWERLVEEVESPYNVFQSKNPNDFLKKFSTVPGALKSLMSIPITGLKTVDVPARHLVIAPISNVLAEFQINGLSERAQQAEMYTPKYLGKKAWQGVTGERQVAPSDLYLKAGAPPWLSTVGGIATEFVLLNAATKNAFVDAIRRSSPRHMGGKWQFKRFQDGRQVAKDFKKVIGSAYDDAYGSIDNMQISTKAQDAIDEILIKADDDVIRAVDHAIGEGFEKTAGRVNTIGKLRQADQIASAKGFKGTGLQKIAPTKGGLANKGLRAKKVYQSLRDVLDDELMDLERSGQIAKGSVEHIKRLNKLAGGENGAYALLDDIGGKFSKADTFEAALKSPTKEIFRSRLSDIKPTVKGLAKEGADPKLTIELIKKSSQLIADIHKFKVRQFVHNLTRIGVPSYVAYRLIDSLKQNLPESIGGGSNVEMGGGGS